MSAPGPDPAEVAAWRAAESLAELGELTARWLTGEMRYQPAYFDTEPDSETAPFVSELAAINRAGFMTDGSQPGEAWVAGGQRAFISGFCSEATVERLRHFLLMTDLVVLAHWPGSEETTYQLAVTVIDRRENTWVGGISTVSDLLHYYDQALSPRALMELASAWQVCVVDPVWGRPGLLFSEVVRALTTAGPIPNPGNPAYDEDTSPAA